MDRNFEILLISPEGDFTNETEIVNELFSQGLTTFHLRKPNWSFEQLQDYLEKIHQQFHNRIILHSHFAITNSFTLKGIHLNEANKKLIEQLKQYNIVSASFHSVQELKENTFPFHYVFLSPVFNSISKPGYHSTFDLTILKEELIAPKQNDESLPKLIALGGITRENIKVVKDIGFSGAALLGAVWESENPVETFLQINDVVGIK